MDCWLSCCQQWTIAVYKRTEKIQKEIRIIFMHKKDGPLFKYKNEYKKKPEESHYSVIIHTANAHLS